MHEWRAPMHSWVIKVSGLDPSIASAQVNLYAKYTGLYVPLAFFRADEHAISPLLHFGIA